MIQIHLREIRRSKKLMVKKNLAFKSYCYFNKNMFFIEKCKALQNQLNIPISLLPLVDAEWLTGWVKPEEIWQFNFCYMNFASRKKFCKNSVFYENMNTIVFILFRKVFIFSRFCLFPFRRCIPLPSLSNIHILRDSVPDLNISTRSVTVDTFNWLKRIFFCLRK